MVFLELIRLAPRYFDIPGDRGRNAENNNHDDRVVV